MAIRKSSRKVFYSAAGTPPLGHVEAESEGLLLERGGNSDSSVTVSSQKAFYLAMRKPSRKVFYSAVATSPTWRDDVE